jgi:hypothetical protein
VFWGEKEPEIVQKHGDSCFIALIKNQSDDDKT